MKYRELKEPGTILQEGDEYIRREELFNASGHWRKELARSFGGDIGKTIGDFPEHAFRRPEPEPIEVTLNPYYKAKVYSDKVVVNNCSNATFGFEAIQYLANMVNKVIRGEHAKEIQQAVNVKKVV